MDFYGRGFGCDNSAASAADRFDSTKYGLRLFHGLHMLIVISPAKSLDFESPVPAALSALPHTQPAFLDRSAALIDILRERSPADISRLMDISDQLAVLNVTRYAEWSPPFSTRNARRAALAFNGDVYEGLAAPTLSADDMAWAQKHLRILSGLYGLLRPLDLMQAYRLEMGTRLANEAGKDLYAFWGDTITEALNADFAKKAEAVLLNLASEEYFKSVRPAKLKARIVTPVFQEWKGCAYKIISFYAKRARGLMSRYAILNRIEDVEQLKAFDVEGYSFDAAASSADQWYFRRKVSA
jgi:uncharacterized protein